MIYDILIILTAGLAAALVCRTLRVSVLIGYLVVGALVGAGGLGWVSDDRHEIEYLAEAGVFLLLFSIGLEFPLNELRRLGRNLIVGGGLQMLLVAGPVAAVLIASGLAWRPAVFIGAAASFSSTVIVFKALNEQGHSTLPHGRRAVGILLFQDAALVPLLLLVPLLTESGATAGPLQYLVLAVTSILFVAAVIVSRHVLATWLIPALLRHRSPDLVVLFTLALLGGVTLATYSVGLPPAIGAFAAGIIFNGNRWTNQIDALVLPFRETFAAVFFVSLGLLFDARVYLQDLWLMSATLFGLVAVKAAAATVALRLTGLRWRAAAGTGLGLAHVGEFAFVLAAMGLNAGVIDEPHYQRLVALAIGSLILTPALIGAGLRWTKGSEGEHATHRRGTRAVSNSRKAIVAGAGPIGRQVTSRLETLGRDVCLIDLSPVNLHPFAQQGIRTVAGNAAESEILELAEVEKASLAVICLPDDEAASLAVRQVRSLSPKCFIVVRCRYQGNVEAMLKAGAHEVVSEEREASDAILRALDRNAVDLAPRKVFLIGRRVPSQTDVTIS